MANFFSTVAAVVAFVAAAPAGGDALTLKGLGSTSYAGIAGEQAIMKGSGLATQIGVKSLAKKHDDDCKAKGKKCVMLQTGKAGMAMTAAGAVGGMGVGFLTRKLAGDDTKTLKAENDAYAKCVDETEEDSTARAQCGTTAKAQVAANGDSQEDSEASPSTE